MLHQESNSNRNNGNNGKRLGKSESTKSISKKGSASLLQVKGNEHQVNTNIGTINNTTTPATRKQIEAAKKRNKAQQNQNIAHAPLNSNQNTQGIAAMNSDLREFGNHLNLVKTSNRSNKATKQSMVQHNFVTTVTKKSPRQHAGAIGNISRVNLSYQQNYQSDGRRRDNQFTIQNEEKSSSQTNHFVMATKLKTGLSRSPRQSPKKSQQLQNQLDHQSLNSTLQINDKEFVRHRAAHVHDWAMNHIKMEQVRRKNSGVENRKKQLLMSVVMPPETTQLQGVQRKIKGQKSAKKQMDSTSMLKLQSQTLQKDNTTTEGSLEKVEPSNETPKFFSNPAIYSDMHQQMLAESDYRQAAATSLYDGQHRHVQQSKHQHVRKDSLAQLKAQEHKLLMIDSQKKRSAAFSIDIKSNRLKQNTSQADIDMLKQFLQYKNSKFSTDNIEMQRATHGGYLPMKQAARLGSDGGTDFLKMARAELLKTEGSEEEETGDSVVDELLYQQHIIGTLPSIKGRIYHESPHYHNNTQVLHSFVDKSGPFLAGQKLHQRSTPKQSNQIVGGGPKTVRLQQQLPNDDLQDVFKTNPSLHGGGELSGPNTNRELAQRQPSKFELQSRRSTTTLEQDLHSIVNRAGQQPLVKTNSSRFQLEGASHMRAHQTKVSIKNGGNSGRNSAHILLNRSNSLKAAQAYTMNIQQQQQAGGTIKTGQVILAPPDSMLRILEKNQRAQQNATKARQYISGKRYNSMAEQRYHNKKGHNARMVSEQMRQSHYSPDASSIKQAASSKIPTINSVHMQQIQVNGADLLYLAQKKITKKRLPEILVQQAAKVHSNGHQATASSLMQNSCDISKQKRYLLANANPSLERSLQENSSSLLNQNSSFQRKVELHWKSKIQGQDTIAMRTQSVSPTTQQLFKFDAYLNSQMLSVETGNSFDSSTSQQSPEKDTNQRLKGESSKQTHHMLIKGESNAQTAREKESSLFLESSSNQKQVDGQNSIYDKTQQTNAQQQDDGNQLHRESSQFSSGHVTTSKQKFKLRFDRTEQTRQMIKNNEESVNSQFSSRVKAAEEQRVSQHSKHRSTGKKSSIKKNAHGKSCTSSQIGDEEEWHQQSQQMMQLSKRTTAGPEDFLNQVEVADLSAQLQQEVESIQITGHQSQMSFRKRTHKQLNLDNEQKQPYNQQHASDSPNKVINALMQTSQIVVKKKGEQLFAQNELVHRGPIDYRRLTGCDNSSADNDGTGYSRKSERSRDVASRVVSRESVYNISQDQRNRIEQERKSSMELQQYSNIPIQQLTMDFKKVPGSKNTSELLLQQTNVNNSAAGGAANTGSFDVQQMPLQLTGQRAVPTKRPMGSRRSSMQHPSVNINKQFFPVPSIPAIARVTAQNPFNQTTHISYKQANNANRASLVGKNGMANQVGPSQITSQTIENFVATEPRVTSRRSLAKNGQKNSGPQSVRESQQADGSNAATISVTVPTPGAPTLEAETFTKLSNNHNKVAPKDASASNNRSNKKSNHTNRMLKDHVLHLLQIYFFTQVLPAGHDP